jgi:hypothetical protein
MYFSKSMTIAIACFDWPTIKALAPWAGWAGVIWAICAHIWNLKKTWLSNSAKMVLDLVDKFDSNDMRHHRRVFANKLLFDRSRLDLSDDYMALQFIEEIGYMTKRGVLDKRMVWNSFFWFLEPYYLALKEPSYIA